MLPITQVTKHFRLGENYMRKMSRTFLSIRFEVCRIWSEMAFTTDETAYDVYVDTFRELTSQCMNLILTSRCTDTTITVPAESQVTIRYPKFIFETGFTPMLFFTAIKCRCLETRLQALQLMGVLGIPRENLWEVKTMQALGRRVIEIEHEIVLTDIYAPFDAKYTQHLPPDEMRVRDTWTESQVSINTTVREHEICGRLAGFFVRNPDDTISLHTEFMDEHEGPPHHKIRLKSPHSAAPSHAITLVHSDD